MKMQIFVMPWIAGIHQCSQDAPEISMSNWIPALMLE
jgi:hypothetical protein